MAGATRRPFEFFKAVHAEGPLHRDHGAFDRLNEAKRHAEYGRSPQHRVDPVGGRERGFDREDHWHEDVADDHDDEIGREVVRALMMQLFPTFGAGVVHLEEFPEHAAFAAGGAAAEETAHRGIPAAHAARNGLGAGQLEFDFVHWGLTLADSAEMAIASEVRQRGRAGQVCKETIRPALSLRAKRSNPEFSRNAWIASSLPSSQ